MQKKVKDKVSSVHKKEHHEHRETEEGFEEKPRKLEDVLVENLIALQKAHTSLAEKFEKLSDQISNLLSLFEMTARSFAEHPAIKASEKDKEFLDKINRLLDQNKTIAKGLTIMEERIKERVYGTGENEEMPYPAPPVPMPPQRQMPAQMRPIAPPQMQPSMASAEMSEEFKPSMSGKPLKRF